MQLDLFLDARQNILVNDLVAALLEGRVTGARTALERLRQENPDHPDLAAFGRLVRSMAEGPAPPSRGHGPLIDAYVFVRRPSLTFLTLRPRQDAGPAIEDYLKTVHLK